MPRDWNSHTNITEHQIPALSGSSQRRRAPPVGRPSVRSASSDSSQRAQAKPPEEAGFRGWEGSDQELYAAPGAARGHDGCAPGGPLAASPLIEVQQPTSMRALNADEAQLYTALFGELPEASGDVATAPARVGGGQSGGLDAADVEAPHLPNLEQAKQIERAVRKAMRGAALERRQAVEAALTSAQREREEAVADAQRELEQEKTVAVSSAADEARQNVLREAEVRRCPALSNAGRCWADEYSSAATSRHAR